MPPRDLVVFIEDEPGYRHRFAYAAALAGKWKAYLIATFVTDHIELHPHADFAVGNALTEMLERHREQTAKAIEATKREFQALARQHGIDNEWRISDRETGESLMLHARHSSLALLGPPARRRANTSILSLSEDVIFASGRPSLLLPRGWPADRIGRRIVVGWNAGREAAAAVAAAMPFLVEADRVHVVVVPDAKVKTLYGPEPGADIARHLARHGVGVVVEQCDGSDAGATLLSRCCAVDADMLVMGAAGRSRVSEFVFGGATRTVLGAVDVPLFLSR